MKVIAAILVLLIPTTAWAGDEPEHREMVYSLAIAAGFSPDESKLLADGSWSMDMNDATTALHGIKRDLTDVALAAMKVVADPQDPQMANRLLSRKSHSELDKLIFSPTGRLARIGPAALLHSLMKDPRKPDLTPLKPGLNAAYHEYIRKELESLQAAGMNAQQLKKLHLLLEGQYLHALVDQFFHPDDPLGGHWKEGHPADQTWRHPVQAKEAAYFTLKELRNLRTSMGGDEARLKILKLDSDEQQRKFCEGLVSAIASGYGLDSINPLNKWTRGEISRHEMVSINAKVEDFMNGFFRDLGTLYTIRIPNFDKVTYIPKGERFHIEYRDKTVDTDIDSFVAWVVKTPRYADEAEAVREAMRQWIRTLAATADSLKQKGLLIQDEFGLPLYKGPDKPEVGTSIRLELEKVAGVNLEVAVEVLELLDVPGIRKARPLARIADASLVSLQHIIHQHPQYLPIGRVHGFVLTADDILLVGTKTRSPIAVDSLVVAVQTVFRDGNTPGVSLDPKADDLSGPQYVRVINVPRRSTFAKIMLEADYKMKEIALGKVAVEHANARGFRSLWDILVDQVRVGGELPPFRSRFWLHPVKLGEKDVQMSIDGSTVLLETRVQLLTEEMAISGGGLVGTGAAESFSEQEAALFSEHMQEIGDDEPVFEQLHGLVDLVTISRVWRRMQLQSSLLDQLVAMEVGEVEVPASKRGLVRIDETGTLPVVLAGGVEARARMSVASFEIEDSLQLLRLRAVATNGTGKVRAVGFPLKVAVPTLREDGGTQLLMSSGITALAKGKFEEAAASFTNAVQKDPDFVDAYVYKGLALSMLGRKEEARSAVVKAISKDPFDQDIAELKLVVDARTGEDLGGVPIESRRRSSVSVTRTASGMLSKGQPSEAIDWADVALSLWPENAEALLVRGMARMLLGQFDYASRDLLQARKPFRRAGEVHRLAFAYALSSMARISDVQSRLPKGDTATAETIRSIAEEMSRAADEANEALRLDPGLDIAQAAYVMSRALKVWSLALLQQEVTWTGVDTAANEFVRRCPNCGDAYMARAGVKLLQEDFKAAIRDLTKATELDPLNSDIWRLLGLAHHQLGDFTAAMHAYQKSLSLASAESKDRGLILNLLDKAKHKAQPN